MCMIGLLTSSNSKSFLIHLWFTSACNLKKKGGYVSLQLREIQEVMSGCNLERDKRSWLLAELCTTWQWFVLVQSEAVSAVPYNLYTAQSHCTLHTAHCTLHTASFTLHTAHCTLHCTRHSTHFSKHSAQYTLLTALATVYRAHYTLHSKLGTVFSEQWTIFPAQ